MPKLKRVSESQLNKDIYDAGEDDRFAEQPDPGRGMVRASQEVMQRRKIVKVSRRKFGGGGDGSGAPPPSAPPPPTTNAAPVSQPSTSSTNPFASTNIATKAAPFAGFSFASNSTSATATSSSAPKPAFSFASSTASAPKPAASTFSFSAKPSGSSSLTTTANSQPKAASAPNTSSLLSTPRSSSVGGSKEDIQQLNENLMKTIVKHWEGGYAMQDYTSIYKEYVKKGDVLQLEDGAEATENGPPAVAAAANNSTLNFGGSSTTNGNSQPASGFSFGAPAPSPAAKPFSMGAPAPAPAGAFSFTSKPAAGSAAGATSAPTFSFGGLSSSSSVGSAPSTTAAAASNGNNDDPTANPDDGKIDKVEQEENTDEEVLYEVRAKHLKLEGGTWKRFGAGVLRLYRHKVTSKCRMVIRNEIGKVQFNVGVSKGMKFEKETKVGKKGTAAYVKFFAVEDAAKGMESFMLQTKPESLDKLHATLEGMVA